MNKTRPKCAYQRWASCPNLSIAKNNMRLPIFFRSCRCHFFLLSIGEEIEIWNVIERIRISSQRTLHIECRLQLLSCVNVDCSYTVFSLLRWAFRFQSWVLNTLYSMNVIHTTTWFHFRHPLSFDCPFLLINAQNWHWLINIYCQIYTRNDKQFSSTCNIYFSRPLEGRKKNCNFNIRNWIHADKTIRNKHNATDKLS